MNKDEVKGKGKGDQVNDRNRTYASLPCKSGVWALWSTPT
jgi:hypothetical protein